MPSSRPVEWRSQPSPDPQSVLANGSTSIAGFNIATGETVVRVVLNLFQAFIWHPPANTPSDGELVSRISVIGWPTAGTQRTLHQGYYRANSALSIYVPSGTANAYWYDKKVIGDQDLGPWDFETRFAGPGIVFGKIVNTTYPGGSYSASGSAAWDLRVLVMLPA